jgi:hypothetical protein
VVDEWPDDAIDVRTREVIEKARGLQTSNPGWPGFASEGHIVGGAVSIALLY